ncbi:carbonic anhydrase [Aquabacterium humicola]|uniref:carbonic anhydrase n=1 Tax=Aquabacterium humicola TaxID=3237377 RepID=UPI002542AB11|nr:carbonic anhydrase family protein [Rubrivivax pictus]
MSLLPSRLAAALVVACAASGPVLAAGDAPAMPRPNPMRLGLGIETKGKPTEHAPVPAQPRDQRDPMDVLRERLAERLGAQKTPDTRSPNVLQVTSRTEGEDHKAPAAAAQAATAAPKPRKAAAPAEGARESTGDLVARLRAEKAAHGGPSGASPHWSYDGQGGPEAWARLNPEFAKCGSGQRQSPIDIRGGIRVDMDPIQFDYRPAAFRVIDNGHTVQVNVGGGNTIEVQGRRYDLVQFHFHRPSEERIDGRLFDMVAHLVHKDAEGRLAVVAVLLDRGSAQPVVQQVWNNLPLEKNEELAAKAPLDLNQLLPQDKRYYTYMGSLTTPPCSEGVLWMVMQQPVAIAQEQINVFARLYPMNARPIQSAAGRLIKQSN